MPPHQVSPATKAAINREEMDAALARLAARPQAQAALASHPRPNTIRIQRIDRASAVFLYGSHDTMFDTACDFLAPDLRPIPPQPNCTQSMKIYEDHRKMAAEYLQVKTELAELRNYKAQLQEELEHRDEPAKEEAKYTQLKSEKEALLAFREKLGEQLAMIEQAQAGLAAGDSAHSTGGSGEDWVVVADQTQGASVAKSSQ